MVGVVAGVAAVDIWLFLFHGVTAGARNFVYRPLGPLLVAALLVVAGAFHELGHGTACRYGGGRPGRIGLGVYLVWPVFYRDATDSYRLDRRERLRTDLGGIYLDLVFVLVSGCVCLVAGDDPPSRSPRSVASRMHGPACKPTPGSSWARSLRAHGDAERELSRAREGHAEALAAASAIREQAQRDAAELLDRARGRIERAVGRVCEALDRLSYPFDRLVRIG
jgi:hypothetical protein